MTMRLTCSSFATHFAIKPWSKSVSSKVRCLVWAITIIAGIFTAGFFQLGCLIARAAKKGFDNDKILQDIFQSTLPGSGKSKKEVLLTSFFDGSAEKYAKPVKLVSDVDLSDHKWFDHMHLRLFAVPFLYSQNLIDTPNCGARNFLGESDLFMHSLDELEAFLLKNPFESEKKYIAYPLQVSGNHFVLLFIDREKRVVEVYDSFARQYGGCKKVTDILTAKDPGKSAYKVRYQIHKPLQQDSYQCGPWVCFFLEQKIKNPDFNFNSLKKIFSRNEISQVIALYRNKTTWKIHDYQKKYLEWQALSLESFKKKHPKDAPNALSKKLSKIDHQELVNAIFEGRALTPENGLLDR